MGKSGVIGLLCFLIHSLFAGAFVADGVRKVISPAELVPEAEVFTVRVTSLVQWVAPLGCSSHTSDRAESWVRIYGAAEVVGGVMFVTGISHRLEACLLASASILNTAVVPSERRVDAEEKRARRPDMLKDMTLLGTSILAAQDPQGRPGASWRRRNTSYKSRRVNTKVARGVRQAVTF